MFGVPFQMSMDKEEEETLLEASETSSRPLAARKGVECMPLFLIASVALNVFLAFLALFHLAHPGVSPSRPSYEAGFDTDLEPAKDHIELVVQPFSGGVELDADGHFHKDQGGHEYVGPPAPAIDEAWQSLLSGLNLDLDQEEVDLADTTFRWPESGLSFSGLDVFHSLHCLNRLRQALYPDYYVHVFDPARGPSRADHIADHCINHIRQSLQCHADLTPMEWRLSGSKVILKTDTPHTCRNFDRIHAWAQSRRTQFEKIQSFMNGSLQIVD
ncbi:hypothetical protein VTK73DRAFT_7288 [Phialemonium thermophilum]|uniref:Uncharacterized protein n=1 Tax=Phialemonium thermophilum TaxID=223376 RepID=A0ABR3WFM2_9PEZI